MRLRSPVRSRSRLRVIRDFLTDRWLAHLAQEHRAAGLPRLAAVVDDHIGRIIATTGLYERHLLVAIRDLVFPQAVPEAHDEVALDIGANIGNHTAFWARCFRTVVAFEPNPAAALLLQANLELNGIKNVVVQRVGLSDENAELPFVVGERNLGGGRFVNNAAVDTVTTRFKLTRGDDVLARLELRARVSLIKVDVEGFEDRVILGLEKTIALHRPLVLFEAADSSHATRVESILRAHGYEHFYCIERSHRFGWGVAARRLEQLVFGSRMYLREVTRFEDRYYDLLIASPTYLKIVTSGSSPG